MHKTFLNWSSGKDALMALIQMEEDKKYSVQKLLTTYNSTYNRVSMHGLSIELLQKQAEALSLPLRKIALSGTTPIEEYSAIMERENKALQQEGFEYAAFGDIALEDLKAYREKQMQQINLKTVFPLWKKDTERLIHDFIEKGYKAIAVCIDAQKLDPGFCGREIDKNFLRDLPENVDPCGENGEFHTFVYDGPRFSQRVCFKKGERVLRDFSPNSEDKKDCFKEDQKEWSQKFYFQELIG